MKLVISGFMGAGKTTLLQKWKKDFQGLSLDLDHEIAKELGVEPGQLGAWIEKEGFVAFRQKESAVLKKLLSTGQSILLALGGGAFHQENQKLLKDFKTLSLWIEVDGEECWKRVSNDSNRPLVKAGKESFLTLYKDRLEDYSCADFKISGSYDFPDWMEFSKKYNLSCY